MGESTSCLLDEKMTPVVVVDDSTSVLSSNGSDSGGSNGNGNDNGTCNKRKVIYRLIFMAAKVVGIVLAALSGAYAILSYYSSIAALRAAVEANKLTLLIYCDSNNSTDEACDQVRADLSPEQAAAEVFDEKEVQPTSVGTISNSVLISTRADSDLAWWRSSQTHTNVAVSATPTTFVRTVFSDGELGSRPTESDTLTSPPTTTTSTLSPGETSVPTSDGGGYKDGIDSDPSLSDYSSWLAICSTLELRADSARQRIEKRSCPFTTSYPNGYESFNPKPRAKLADSCSALSAQYWEAKRGLESWSCLVPSYQPSRPTTLSTSRLKSPWSPPTTTAETKPKPEPNNPKADSPVEQHTNAITWQLVGALLLGLIAGYVVRLLRARLKRRKEVILARRQWMEEALLNPESESESESESEPKPEPERERRMIKIPCVSGRPSDDDDDDDDEERRSMMNDKI